MKTIATNCPNCGAPLTSDGYCSYCNTKVRYANEVEVETFLHNGAIYNTAMEVLFKFIGIDENGDKITYLIPFKGCVEEIELTRDEHCAYSRYGNKLLSVYTGPPTVNLKLQGVITNE